MRDKKKTPKATDTWSLAPPFRQEGDFSWIADLPVELHALTDCNEEAYRSRLRLFEDDRLLGPAHAVHENIRTSGRGAYSFWGSGLYFSTSDGTDPNVNGHAYSVVLPALRPQPKSPEAAVELSWSAPPRLLRCALFGLGNRGAALGRLAQSLPGVEITWVVDRSAERIAEAPKLFGTGVKGTADLLEPLNDPAVDIVFVTVPDYLHRQVAEPAFRAGKHVFLEKPVATTAVDAMAIVSEWQRSGRVLQLGYVLRQAPFYAAIRKLVREDGLGPVRIASLSEQLDVRHGGTFMRRWHAQSNQSGGLMVHKGCHDLDIICWLLDARPRKVASFGGLDTFGQPAPAQFCSQCSRRGECPYVDTALHERRASAEVLDPTAYGLDRCVFHAGKDIVDNQVVSFELDSGIRGTFYLAVQGPTRSERRITLIGDQARLDGVFEDGRFTVTFADTTRPPLIWTADGTSRGGHGGGDRITMLEFLNACTGHSPPPIRNAEEALRGLIFALAAEKARKGETTVRLDEADFALPG